jgi:hypothetical protein
MKQQNLDLAESPASDGPGIVGTVVSNGHEHLLIPEGELKKIDAIGREIATDHFDWERAEDIAVPEQRAIAIYNGGSVHLVIRQERGPYDDDHLA